MPRGALLCSLDVKSLYTNIGHIQGVYACAYLLNLHRPRDAIPSNQSIIGLLNLVLKKNAFEFNGDYYLQISGTAMGTKCAPSFANLTMHKFELDFVYNYRLKPLCYYRFIDDIFFIWTHGREELDNFIQHLNGCHPTIKFTSEISDKEIAFLDTTTYITPDGDLKHTLYCKPTDKHNYLLFDSCHPKHTQRGIPYSQFLRLRTICTDLSEFDKHAIYIGSHFARRDYPPDLIEENLLRARRLDRQALLVPPANNNLAPNDTNEESFFLTTTYNPANPHMRDLIATTWDLLKEDEDTMALHPRKIIYGNRRAKNLKDILTKARISYHWNDSDNAPTLPLSQSTNACNRRNCRYCPLINTTDQIVNKYNGRPYTILHDLTCRSNNLVYVITCKVCGIQYVGETYRCLYERLQGHFGDVDRKDLRKTIGKHYNLPGHNGWRDMSISGIYYCRLSRGTPNNIGRAAQAQRRRIEDHYIGQLNTLAPMGLNRREDMNSN